MCIRDRITCGAAVAFNARVALNFNDWERVKKYTEKLIDKADYGRDVYKRQYIIRGISVYRPYYI